MRSDAALVSRGLSDIDLLEDWEDKWISVGQAALGALLVPTLGDPRAAVPLGTSIPTGLILLTFAAAFHSKGMDRSKYTAFATGLLWLLIAVLRHP